MTSQPTLGKENTKRVFLAGAGGAIGTRLVPQLIDRGHEVIGTFRSSPEKAERLRAIGAEPIALDYWTRALYAKPYSTPSQRRSPPAAR